jgi:RNA polymerase sigma-70 factor (ECF subfamily)
MLGAPVGSRRDAGGIRLATGREVTMKPSAWASSGRLLPAEVRPAELDGSSALAARAMDRYARGDDAAFADVYDAIAPRVLGYLLRQTRDRARAEDLLQLTLLQMHRHRGSYVAGLAVLPWAIAIARRLFIDDLRRRKTDALSAAANLDGRDPPALYATEELVASHELAVLVDAELARLPEAQRVAFELLKFEGLSMADAAQVLGTTVSAVKLRAFRAYAAIRTILERALENPTAEGKSEAP